MHPMPHHYTVSACSEVESIVTISTKGLDDIQSTPPPEFDGPEGYWSPESLLEASLADCFVLTFKAVAKASKLDWISISCDVVGELDRIDRVTKFTQFTLDITVNVPAEVSPEKVEKIAHKSEKNCLVSNSLSAEKVLNVVVRHS